MELPETVLRLFSPPLSDALRAAKISSPEELRCRLDRPITVVAGGRGNMLSATRITAGEIDRIVERASRSSLYSHQEELRHGFIHASGGVRIGLCGTINENEHDHLISGIRQISSLSIRIPREIRGCADEIYRILSSGLPGNTLILSPPGYGKTTLLRDLIRLMSDGGLRVSVADERGEISAACDRVPGFDLGLNTDVMVGGRKRDSAMMLLRSMSPQVLAFDEITDPEDLEMIAQVIGCGARLLATAHAKDKSALQKRALYRSVLSAGIFDTAVWILQEGGKRRYCLETL